MTRINVGHIMAKDEEFRTFWMLKQGEGATGYRIQAVDRSAVSGQPETRASLRA